MKAPALLLALGTLLGAHAQTAPPASTPNPSPSEAKAIRAQTAERRAAAYNGPKAVKNSKELGRKMIEKSKPTDGLRRPIPVK
jgi:hypothetical protein